MPQLSGPLRASSRNPRYFADATGSAVYLTGSHVWQSGKDMAKSDPPSPFGYDAYLELMVDHGHNFMRMWTWELAKYTYDGVETYSAPHPWPRLGPGDARDGKPRFDLSSFDEAWFSRLRSRVESAAAKGIYVSVMLFEGHGLHASLEPWCRDGHPFCRHNNINDIDGDPRDTGRILDIHTLAIPAVTDLQEAYVRRVVETVNDLDNVLYEISNETGAYSTEWQYHLIDFIHDLERGMPNQHPVGMTFQQAQHDKGVNQALFDGPADWISPNPEGGYREEIPPADGSKVVLNDTDHLWGLGCVDGWVWKTFTRGHNPILMDPITPFPGIDEHPNWGAINQPDHPLWAPLRKQLGDTRRYAQRLNLNTTFPHGELASTGYCLAEPGRAYLAYLPEGGEVTIDLTAATGTLQVEWFDIQSHQVTATDTIQGGQSQAFKSPCPGQCAVLVWG